MSQFFASGRWPKYWSFSSSISEYSVLISLQSKGLSRVFSNTTVQKHEFFRTQLSPWVDTVLKRITGRGVCVCEIFADSAESPSQVFAAVKVQLAASGHLPSSWLLQ